MVEYRPQHKATGVDAAAGIVRFEVQDDVRADVLNVLPPMRAGADRGAEPASPTRTRAGARSTS